MDMGQGGLQWRRVCVGGGVQAGGKGGWASTARGGPVVLGKGVGLPPSLCPSPIAPLCLPPEAAHRAQARGQQLLAAWPVPSPFPHCHPTRTHVALQVFCLKQHIAFEHEGSNFKLVLTNLLVDVNGQSQDTQRGFLADNTAFIFTNSGQNPIKVPGGGWRGCVGWLGWLGGG